MLLRSYTALDINQKGYQRTRGREIVIVDSCHG